MSARRWEVVGNAEGGYRVRNTVTGRCSTATPTHSLKLATQERDRLNAEHEYTKRVRQLEAQGLTTSDAQAAIDVEDSQK